MAPAGDRVVAIFAQRLNTANDARIFCQLVLAFPAKFHLCIVVRSWSVHVSSVGSKVVFELSFFGFGNVFIERVVVVVFSNLDLLE